MCSKDIMFHPMHLSHQILYHPQRLEIQYINLALASYPGVIWARQTNECIAYQEACMSYSRPRTLALSIYMDCGEIWASVHCPEVSLGLLCSDKPSHNVYLTLFARSAIDRMAISWEWGLPGRKGQAPIGPRV